MVTSVGDEHVTQTHESEAAGGTYFNVHFLAVCVSKRYEFTFRVVKPNIALTTDTASSPIITSNIGYKLGIFLIF